MKQTVYGAVIIALGLIISNLLGVLVLKNAITGVPRDALSKSIDGLVEKDKDGASRIESIAKEISKSFASGLAGGFSHLNDSQMAEVQRYKNQFVISEVKAVPTSWSQQEKIIGYVENQSEKSVSSISFQLMVKDSSGSLIDVVTSDGKIAGGIGAKSKVGFEMAHETKANKNQDGQETTGKNTYVVNVVNMKFLANP
jgi:hypothetical protein